MASPFDSAGANHEGSDYAPLVTDEYFTGLVTNRNPLRDADVPYLERKFYQAGRFDSMWDGINVEISSKLTLIKRPGSSVFNSQHFPPARRFYEFRTLVDGVDIIHTMMDSAPYVYDASGPATKKLIWTKSAGSGKTSFLSVGNTLYFGNGVDQKKWTLSTRSYRLNTRYTAGQFINDPNGNIQVAFGVTKATVTASRLHSGIGTTALNRVILTLDQRPFVAGQPIAFDGLTNAAILNGGTYPVITAGLGIGPNDVAVQLSYVPTFWAAGPDTGSASSDGTGASGVTGSAAPAWGTNLGATTFDGSIIWINKGSEVQDWGTAAPTSAPITSFVTKPNPYPVWQASTFYGYKGTFFSGVLGGVPFAYQATVAGMIDATPPTFDPIPGHTTVWNTATFTTLPAVTWTTATAFSVGDYTVNIVPGALYVCVQGGLSGVDQSTWATNPGAIVVDGSCVWECLGTMISPLAAAGAYGVAVSDTIIEAGYLQTSTGLAISGTTAPAWGNGIGDSTPDFGQVWQCTAEFAVAGTAPTTYAYSFGSSVSKLVSTASPLSAPKVLPEGASTVIQGYGSTDPQDDTIYIWATLQGGSTLLLLTTIPAPIGAGLWTYVRVTPTGINPDGDLNPFITAPIAHVNDPPPVGLINLCYHMGRIWGSVGILQYFCTGPAVTVGNGNEAWAPSNVFAMPDQIARSEPWDLPGGVLLIFTASTPYAIWGTGTANDPFYPKRFTQGSGLLSYDAFAIAGTRVHMFTTDQRLLSFEPSAGYAQTNVESEDTGHAIGDQFLKVTTGGINAALYDPKTAYLTWHSRGTNDTALIAADGKVGWFRYSPIGTPETGFLWHPRAAIVGGTSAVQSVETKPGIKTLLIGPPQLPDEVLNITDVEIVNGTATLTHSNLFLPIAGMPFVLAGLTTVAALNGQTVRVTSATSGAFEFDTTLGDHALASETGTATGDGAWITSGPILMRDSSVNADNAGLYSDAYATVGSIQLAQPSEEAEVADIMLDSKRVGTAPTVAVLLGEISATPEVPFVMLERTGFDPPLLAPSETLFNDRFTMLQNGKATLCRHMQLKIQMAAEDAQTEVLTHTIYGRRIAERKQQAPA